MTRYPQRLRLGVLLEVIVTNSFVSWFISPASRTKPQPAYIRGEVVHLLSTKRTSQVQKLKGKKCLTEATTLGFQRPLFFSVFFSVKTLVFLRMFN